MRSQPLLDQTGTYMLEVLIGIFLFGVAMMGLGQLGYASMLSNKSSQRLTDATILAQDRIEYVKSLGFAKADSARATEDYGAIDGYLPYKRVTQVDTTGNKNLKNVAVTVYWDRGRHSFVLQTVLAR